MTAGHEPGRRNIMNHDHYADDYLADILMNSRNVAVLGASTRDSRPSFWITGFLLGKGHHVHPVNPDHEGEDLMGQHVYGHLADLPEPVDMIDIFRRSEALGEVVDEILALPWRPKAIWCQLGVRDDVAAAKAEAAGIKVVMNCSLASEYLLVYQRTHQLHSSAA